MRAGYQRPRRGANFRALVLTLALRGEGGGAWSGAAMDDSTRRTQGLAGRPRAVLLGVQLPDVSDAELASSLDELARLATTLGLEPVARVTQRRERLAAAAVVGTGKLKELAEWTGGPGAVPQPGPPGTHGGKKRAESSDAGAGSGAGRGMGRGRGPGGFLCPGGGAAAGFGYGAGAGARGRMSPTVRRTRTARPW